MRAHQSVERAWPRGTDLSCSRSTRRSAVMRAWRAWRARRRARRAGDGAPTRGKIEIETSNETVLVGKLAFGR